MDLALHTQGLRREFGTFVAVDGIDIEVPRGSLYGFVGPNGAGKSTTIKCLTGLLKPSAGTMRILGLDPTTSPEAVKRQVGVVAAYLAQSPGTALLAAWFPAPFDLTRLRAGNPHPLASILGLMVMVFAYGVCGGTFAATLALTRRPWAGFLAAALLLLAGGILARMGWRIAALSLDARRENLALVAEGK